MKCNGMDRKKFSQVIYLADNVTQGSRRSTSCWYTDTKFLSKTQLLTINQLPDISTQRSLSTAYRMNTVGLVSGGGRETISLSLVSWCFNSMPSSHAQLPIFQCVADVGVASCAAFLSEFICLFKHTQSPLTTFVHLFCDVL